MAKTRAGDIIGSGAPAALDDRDILYTRPEAAEYLRKSVPTLERWAAQGIGPKPLKVGPRDVRYTLRSLRETAGTEAA
jgi:predicted DNA-binding transcriptional regulator AlpA